MAHSLRFYGDGISFQVVFGQRDPRVSNSNSSHVYGVWIAIWKVSTLEKGELQTKSERGPIAGDAQARTKLRGPSKMCRLVALLSTDVRFPPKPHVRGQRLVRDPGTESGIVGRLGWDLSYTAAFQ